MSCDCCYMGSLMKLNKIYVYLFFVVITALAAFVFSQLVRDVYNLFLINNYHLYWLNIFISDFIGIVCACFLVLIVLISRPDAFIFIEKCIYELSKIKWPSFSETKVATFLVIIISCFIATLIAVFDIVFSWLTNNKFIIGFFI